MSTLNTTNIKHASSSSNSIVLAADGTFTGNITNRPNRNILINGDMRICQRSTSTTSINAYIVDRWRSYGGALDCTISQQTDATAYPRSRTALRLHRTSGTSQTNNTGLAQGVETLNSKPYAGETLTLSFKARCGANFSSASNALTATIAAGEGTDENPVGMTNTNSNSSAVTLTTSVQSFSVSYAVPADKTQLRVSFAYTPTGTAGANDWFEITECQLEVGSVPSDFEYRDYQSELARCQRYYEHTYNEGIAPGANSSVGGYYGGHSGDGSNNVVWSSCFAVRKRAVPTMTFYTDSGTSGSWNYQKDGTNSTATVTFFRNSQTYAGGYLGAGGSAAWNGVTIYGHWTASAEL